MTPTPPPAPQLLSGERIVAITEWHKRLFANYEKHATDETINAAGLSGVGVLLDDMADLLADRAAYRLLVQQELQQLRAPYVDSLKIESAEKLTLTAAEWKFFNSMLDKLATRLGLDLSTGAAVEGGAS